MGPQILGIKETKEIIAFALASISMVKSAQADGHIGFEDLGLLFQVGPTVGPAIQGIGGVLPELANLSPEEVAELLSMVQASHAVDGEKAMKLISAAFKVIGGVIEGISALKA